MTARKMKEAGQVVAAVQIVAAARSAIASAMDEHRATGWDTEILVHELARALAFALRLEDAPPSQFDDVVLFLRRVYGGVRSTDPMTVEHALRCFCAAPEADADAAGADEAVAPTVVH